MEREREKEREREREREMGWDGLEGLVQVRWINLC